jgi:hypothetical protein
MSDSLLRTCFGARTSGSHQQSSIPSASLSASDPLNDFHIPSVNDRAAEEQVALWTSKVSPRRRGSGCIWRTQLLEAATSDALLGRLDQLRAMLDSIDRRDRIRLYRDDLHTAILAKRNAARYFSPFQRLRSRLSKVGATVLGTAEPSSGSANIDATHRASFGTLGWRNAPPVVPVRWTNEVHYAVTDLLQNYFEGAATEQVPGVLMEHVFSYVDVLRMKADLLAP